MKQNTFCGFSCWHPEFLQRFATTKSFIIVYGILGTIQAMGYIYFVMTLQTIEKRFAISSKTMGIILSGNEISQILLSLVLTYFGGQRNRPRWIAWGVIFCAFSCFILASPHFLYGAGEDSLRLTQEYVDATRDVSVLLNVTAAEFKQRATNRLCLSTAYTEEECDEIISIVPLILIFSSQFVLGIGNTLYYSLGQTYLDDNTKKTNIPLLLGYAFALRTLGPVVGFVLGYACLKIYIDPTKTPLIDSMDPRWLGAWWLGWVLLGIAMLLVAILIGLFPKELPKKKKERVTSTTPKMLQNDDVFGEENLPLRTRGSNANELNNSEFYGSMMELPPSLKDFPTALMRLLKNKLLMCNILSGIFYILGSSGYITFLSKYLEVQFHRNAADATIITGPITLIGMVVGFLLSGLIISKKKPGPRKLLAWNVFVGIGYMVGQVIYLFLTCPDGKMPLVQGRLNLSTECNSACVCDGMSYSPVCHEETGYTFFSPCHAGCNTWTKEKKLYQECECANDGFSPIELPTILPEITMSIHQSVTDRLISTSWQSTTLISSPEISSTAEPSKAPIIPILPNIPLNSQSPLSDSNTTRMFDDLVEQSEIVEELKKQLKVSMDDITEADNNSSNITVSEEVAEQKSLEDYEENYYDDEDEETAPTQTDSDKMGKQIVDKSLNDEKSSKKKRELSEEAAWGVMIPGACLKGCAFGFFVFSVISSIINCFGASGRIGNLLVNYRCVSTKDKSFTQGLILMLISLFALIPGPIIYGRIIDSTCLVWTETCGGKRGNCQLYDQKLFRYFINFSALALTSIGVFFDFLVWKLGQNLDLYGEREAQEMVKQKPDR